MIPFAPAEPSLHCAMTSGAVATLVMAASDRPMPPAAAADTLRIAAAREPLSLYVAQRRGFFADEHVDVAISGCVGGPGRPRQVLDDKVDLAATSEMPVVLQAFARGDVAIVATMAQAILRERLKLDRHFVDGVWGGLGLRLSLDQALPTTMEGEMRWTQREGHVPGAARPNVSTPIHSGPMTSVTPDAVGTDG